jgi:hypothetical protein
LRREIAAQLLWKLVKILSEMREKSLETKREGARTRRRLRPVCTELTDLSANAVSRDLNRHRIPTTTGKLWSPVMVIRIRKRLEHDPRKPALVAALGLPRVIAR